MINKPMKKDLRKVNKDTFHLLDNGVVRLVDHMGNDLSVVKAARVSYGNSGSKGKVGDQKLIDFLWKNEHQTPFEHVYFTYYVKCPQFVRTQFFRHRIASYNEKSGRYAKVTDEFYVPSDVRQPDKKNKQSSVVKQSPRKNWKRDNIRRFERAYDETYKIYKDLLEDGVAKEMARMVLPNGIYTEFYATMNVRSLANFWKLRLEKDAQYEIQVVSRAMYELAKPMIPMVMGAIEKYSGFNLESI